MNGILKTILFVTAFTALVIVVFPVTAQINTIQNSTCGDLGISCTGSETTTDLADKIKTVVNAALVFASIVAVIFLIVGGAQYITSAGDEQKAAQAKKTILYSIVGVIAIILSAVIANFIIALF